MSYKVKGMIVSIGQKKTLDNGACVLDYVVNETSDNGYVTPYSFNMYNKAEYAELVDKFIEFNKPGDEVEIEFTVRGREYNGKIYNSFSHWRCDKIKEADKAKQTEPVESDLPF
jgi:hypothetical protein